MAVERGNRYAVRAKGTLHRGYFHRGHDEITGDCHLPFPKGLKVDCRGDAHGRRHELATFMDSATARHAHLVGAAVHATTGAKNTRDCRSIELNASGGDRRRLRTRRFRELERRAHGTG